MQYLYALYMQILLILKQILLILKVASHFLHILKLRLRLITTHHRPILPFSCFPIEWAKSTKPPKLLVEFRRFSEL